MPFEKELIIPDEIHDLLRWSDWIRAYRATAELFDRKLAAAGPAHLLLLEASSALKQVNDQHDHRNYEQEMDQTAANVADKAKKPEHDQDNNYSPKHRLPPFG